MALPFRFFEFWRRWNLGVVRNGLLVGVVSGIGPKVWGILVGKLANFGFECPFRGESTFCSSFGFVLFKDSFINIESFKDPSSSTSILWLSVSVGKIGDGVSWIGTGVGDGVSWNGAGVGDGIGSSIGWNQKDNQYQHSLILFGNFIVIYILHLI